VSPAYICGALDSAAKGHPVPEGPQRWRTILGWTSFFGAMIFRRPSDLLLYSSTEFTEM